jgi:hypothetical protein
MPAEATIEQPALITKKAKIAIHRPTPTLRHIRSSVLDAYTILCASLPEKTTTPTADS